MRFDKNKGTKINDLKSSPLKLNRASNPEIKLINTTQQPLQQKKINPTVSS